jgi:glyoxylase-like metal-dependent hydrolase (beta-lactamase superfamily II)
MEALKEQGNDAVRRGDFHAAADLYDRAIEAATGDLAPLHSNASFAYLKLADLPQALRHAESAVAANPAWSKGHFWLGEALFAAQDYTAAEKAYARASELAAEDATLKKKVTLAREAMAGFYFRQLLAGRDFAVNAGNIIERQIFSSAKQMQNYVYLIGDARTREAVVVDAAWDVKGIRSFAAAENMRLVGAVVTHYHFDHTGGTPPPPFDQLGIKVPGVRELAVEDKLPVYVNLNDATTVMKSNGVPSESLTLLEDAAEVSVGGVKLKFIHTPGHTPGSQCIHIERPEQDILISGDTLFIGSCGRLDLPDCNAKLMYNSLQKKLAALPATTRVYPGHDYGGPYTTISREREQGFLKPMNEGEWMRMHGH